MRRSFGRSNVRLQPHRTADPAVADPDRSTALMLQGEIMRLPRTRPILVRKARNCKDSRPIWRDLPPPVRNNAISTTASDECPDLTPIVFSELTAANADEAGAVSVGVRREPNLPEHQEIAFEKYVAWIPARLKACLGGENRRRIRATTFFRILRSCLDRQFRDPI